jgi:hypothetical protein
MSLNAMTDTDLQEILTECIPGDILKRNGQILYSGIDTLRPAESRSQSTCAL